MLKLRISQPGRPDQVVEVASDEVIIGRTRAAGVVTVSQPHISKRHAKVMAGVVIVDLGSRNGTYVDGERIEHAAFLPRGGALLGKKDESVLLQVEGHEGIPTPSAAVIEAETRPPLQTSESREDDSSTSETALRDGDPAELSEAASLRRERDDLRRRVEALKKEVESRDVAGSEGLQARLASESLQQIQQVNEGLRARVSELESKAAAPALEAAKAALQDRVAALEGIRAGHEQELADLRIKLEQAESAAQPLPASELFFKLQAENTELRQKLEQSAAKEPSGAAGSEGSSEVFFELRTENEALRARLEELQRVSQDEAAPAGEEDSAELESLRKSNHELSMSKADLLTELDQLRSKLEARAAAPIVPAIPPGKSQLLPHLANLVDEDVEAHPEGPDGAIEVFLSREMFRFLRVVERVVTRSAGSFMQLYEAHTILPDMKSDARALFGDVLKEPEDATVRENLLEYLAELRKWLVVALGAHQRSAERFAERLRNELSERSLTTEEPIPAYKKLAGLGDAELWQRTKTYLKSLTADVVEERLDSLSRECADEILREQSRS